MKKYVFDTNTLIENPDLIKEYDSSEEETIVPMAVLEEIDKFKNTNDMLGFNSRELIRNLESYNEIQYLKPEKTKKYIRKIDDVILQIAKEKNAILVTNDKILKIKAKANSVEIEEPRVSQDINSRLYKGFKEFTVNKDFIDQFYEDNQISLDEDLNENQYVLFKGPKKQSAIGKVKNGVVYRISNNYDDYKSFGITPRNIEQLISMHALLDPNISVVSLVGLAGSGKTLLALSAGLKQVFGIGNKDKEKFYKRIIVTRPIQVVGNDIGYLPGTLEEKMHPWLAPIYDNLEVLTHNNTKIIENWFESGKIQVEAMAYIRGRSIPDSFIILDEAQNISPHEIKTILTRVGENTKIILTGDIEQIDNPKLNLYSNGLTYMIEKFKPYKLSAHVSLVKGERSEVAALAAKVL